MSCFVLEQDINPDILRQYNELVNVVSGRQQHLSPPPEDGPKGPGGKGGSRIIPLSRRKER
jgi:hypothetical protein